MLMMKRGIDLSIGIVGVPNGLVKRSVVPGGVQPAMDTPRQRYVSLKMVVTDLFLARR
jgi:hypothetical protein